MKLKTDQILGLLDAVLGKTNKTARVARKKASAMAEDLTESSRAELIRLLDNLQRRLEPPPSPVRNILQFSAGLLVGIGIGMLVAPEGGALTREKIAGKAADLSNVIRVSPRNPAV